MRTSNIGSIGIVLALGFALIACGGEERTGEGRYSGAQPVAPAVEETPEVADAPTEITMPEASKMQPPRPVPMEKVKATSTLR